MKKEKVLLTDQAVTQSTVPPAAKDGGNLESYSAFLAISTPHEPSPPIFFVWRKEYSIDINLFHININIPENITFISNLYITGQRQHSHRKIKLQIHEEDLLQLAYL